LVRNGIEGFHFFAFAPFGVPILVLGIAYMAIARRWLAAADGTETTRDSWRPTFGNWLDEYKLAGREHRVRVRADSELVGQTLAEIRMRSESGANLIAIERNGQLLQPHANSELRAGDVLFVDLF